MKKDSTRRLATQHLVAASLISTLLLQGCGGGGGGHSSSAPNGGGGGGSTPVTVSGVAAKGLLLNAIVTFYPVTNGSVGSTALATVRTSATDGSFSSPVSSDGSVVAVLTVDESTLMLDELSGAPIAAPEGLVLRAVLPGVTNLQPLAITPLTELAYTRAASNADGLTVTNIDAANSAIGSAFLNGGSILQTLPIDITKYATATPAQQAQAKLLTAISVAADQNIATGADGVACEGEYPLNVPCVVEGLSRLVSFSAAGTTFNAEAGYLSAAYEAINSGAVNVGGKTPAELGLNVPTAAENALVQNIQTQNPLPGYNPSADPLVNTKDLIANIRTNIVKQGALESFGFSETVDRLSDEFNQNVEPVASMTLEVVPSIYACALALIGEGDAIHCNVSGNTAFQNIWDGNDYSLEPGANGSYTQSWTDRSIKLTITKTGDTEYSVTTLPYVRTWTSTCAASSCEWGDSTDETPVASELTATFTLTKSGDAHSASFSGPFYVDSKGGYVTADLQAAQSSDWNDEALSGSLTLSGSLSKGGGGVSLKSASFGSSTIHVRNGNTELFQPEKTYSEGGFTWTESDGLPRTIAGNPAIAVWGALNLGQWVTEEFSYAGKLTIDEPTYDASNTLGVPGNIKLDASVSEVLPGSVYAPLFKGSFGISLLGAAAFDATKPVVEDNTLTVQLSTDGTLYLLSGRVLSVSATVNADPTSVEDEDGESSVGLSSNKPASFLVTYRYSTPAGTAELNASGEYDADGNLDGRITNNAGVTIDVKKPADGKLSGTITAGGVETATIDDSGFVYYSDGSSESVF